MPAGKWLFSCALLFLLTFSSFYGQIVINPVQTPPTCVGGSDGQIDLQITGGSPPYALFYQNAGVTNAQNGGLLTGLTPGLVVIEIVDQQSLTLETTLTLDDRAPMIIHPNPFSYYGYNIACNGGSNGGFNLGLANVVSPWTIEWEKDGIPFTPPNQQWLVGQSAGEYTITVTDGCGVESRTVTLTQPNIVQANMLRTGDNFCADELNGSFESIVSGGVGAGYTYHWDGPNGFSSNDEDISGLASGTYTFYAEDANGCASRSVFQNLDPLSDLAVGFCEPEQWVTLGYEPEAYAQLVAIGSGGTPPYTYQWSTGETDPVRVVHPAFTQDYTVTITDAVGCTAQAATTVNVIDVRCGTYNERVNMCKTNGISQDCQPVSNVATKLGDGWSLGDCSDNYDYSGGQCGNPTFPSCDCEDGIARMVLDFSPMPGGYIQVIAGGQTIFQALNILGPIAINASQLPGGIFPANVSILVNYGGANTYTLNTACDQVAVGDRVGPFTVTEITDGRGGICNQEAMGPDCPCRGWMSEVDLRYVGPGTVNVLYNNRPFYFFAPFGRVDNVSTDEVFTLDFAGGFFSLTYVEIEGVTAPKTMINTSCAGVQIGKRYGFFEVVGYTDGTGNVCPGSNKTLNSDPELVSSLELNAAPNPFSSATKLRFESGVSTSATLTVMGVDGREVARLFAGPMEAGIHYSAEFAPDGLSQGVYIARLVTGNGRVVHRKLILH